MPLCLRNVVVRNRARGSKAKIPLKILIHEDEKRPRDSRMPFVMLDPQVFDFVDFHVHFYQPFLLDKYAIQKGTKDSQKLLLDTRNGHPMTSDNVRNTLVKFARAVDPELHLKPMTLRSSYATIMIRRHVHRDEIGVAEHFQALTEDEFCTMLATVLNTSVTQIRNVYAAASHADYSAHVARIMSICKSIPDSDEFDMDC